MGEGVGRPEGSAGGGDPLERVRLSFERQGLMRMLGAKVVEAGEGFCTIEVPFGDEVTQQERYFRGAVVGAIGDNAGGYAAMTLAPPDREVLTVEYKIDYLVPARGERLVAWGEVVTAGRRLFVCRSEVSVVDGGDERVRAAMLQTAPLSPSLPRPREASPHAATGYILVVSVVSIRWKGERGAETCTPGW
jgi:uncharacterized protein (TIGR00369 family)